MSENPEITEEQRAAVREKYGAQPAPSVKNGSLSALGWISAVGFIIAIVSMIIVMGSRDVLAVTIWGGLVGTGITVGFLALIAYLATKAIITSRR